MKVGLPKEIKNNEGRVGMTPMGVKALVNHGHKVYVEKNAGLASGINDSDYITAGATIVNEANKAWDVDLVVKVKEPQESEYQYFKEGLLLYTYLHLAPLPNLINALKEKKVNAIAYETVELDDGSLPLLTPMSEIAGRRAITLAAEFLEKHKGGQGILLGGVPGTYNANVIIIGAGVSGLHAARMAVGLGANVTILDINIDKLRYIDDVFPNIQTLYSSEHNLAKIIKTADVVISTVLIPGSNAPKIVKEYMVKSMKKGSVIIDVAIDQGGSIETIDRVTTHDDPIYEKYDVLHYAVANMPGAVAKTATYALTNATLPYLLQLADNGIKACLDNTALARGANLVAGKTTYKSVAQAINEEYHDACKVISHL